ncbi:MAG TPA: NAD(P)H-dependent oxidoreductase [Rugosimonospora sp.]
MSLFRLDASIRTEGSVSREVADTVEKAWRAEHPHAPVIRRDLGLEPLPATAWRDAVSAGRTPAEERTPQQAEASALSDALVSELLDAEAYLFAVPLYNYGVPQHVKAWIDMILADPRGTSTDSPLLAGRPGVLVLARGGGYGPGTPREGWDHAGPYLQRIFSEVWGMDLHVAEAELTLAGVVPAMASLIGLADQSLRDAHLTADSHGRTIAERVRAAAA